MTYVLSAARIDEDNVASKYKRRKDVIATSHIITALKVTRLSDSTTNLLNSCGVLLYLTSIGTVKCPTRRPQSEDVFSN
jgi:hypothetical protein